MKLRNAILLICVMLLILACNASATPAPPEPTQAPAAAVTEIPTAIPTPVGVSISANGTSFLIPQMMAGGAVVTRVAASTATADMPYWEVYPEHLQFDINGYLPTDTFHTPRMKIYPAVEFSQMSEGAALSISGVQGILANSSAPLPEHLPFLPIFNAAQVFHANEKILTFQNGQGIRYVTQYGQAPFPANNQEIFYTFQGITSDGKYYVAAVMPVNIAFLPPNGNPDTPLPPSGIPFDWSNLENTQAHFNLVAQKLNEANQAEFLPALDTLDAMMQSISAGIQ